MLCVPLPQECQLLRDYEAQLKTALEIQRYIASQPTAFDDEDRVQADAQVQIAQQQLDEHAQQFQISPQLALAAGYAEKVNERYSHFLQLRPKASPEWIQAFRVRQERLALQALEMLKLAYSLSSK